MRKRRRTRLLRRLVLGVAVAAAAVPVAQARPDAAGALSERELPQDSGLRALRIAHDAAGVGWSDAGLGAGSALGIVLLGGAAARTTGHLGRAATA